MRTSLDTNILSSLWSGEPSAAGILRGLAKARTSGRLILSPVAYAELFAHPRVTEATIKSFLVDVGIEVDFNLDEAIWSESGRRFALYAARRRASSPSEPRRILPDFVVGTHALLRTDRLMTLDIDMFRTNFPELRLYPV